MKKQIRYKKNYRIQGQCITSWTVDEILKELQKRKKYKNEESSIKGTDNIEIYPKINDYGRIHWHFDVYRYDEVVK